MADQTTLSSIDDSILNADVTTTTTPPISDLSFMKGDNNSAQSSSTNKRSITPDLDDINGVLGGLNLDLDSNGNLSNNLNSNDTKKTSSSIFSAQFSPLNQHTHHIIPSTPPQSNTSSSSNVLSSNQQQNVTSTFQPRTPNWSTSNNRAGTGTGLASFGQSILPDLSNTPQQSQESYMQFDPSSTSHQHQFLSLTPNAASGIPNFGNSHFGGGGSDQSTPFVSSKISVPSSAPPARRTTTLGFGNTRPFMLPETTSNNSNSNSTNGEGLRINEQAIHDENSVYDANANQSNIDPSSVDPTSSSSGFFGPPLLGETSRRLTYPVSTSAQQQLSPDSANDAALSALHPALTNELLAGTVAGGSIGMGISPGTNDVKRSTDANDNNSNGPGNNSNNHSNNNTSNNTTNTTNNNNSNANVNGTPTNYFNSVPFNSFGSFHIPAPSPGMGVMPNQMHLASANTISYPPVGAHLNQPGQFGAANNYARSTSFPGFTNNNGIGKQQQQQQQQQLPPLSQQQQQQQAASLLGPQGTSPNGSQQNRTNLGLNATANVHRKHTSNKRRGEDASKFINASLNDFVNEIYFLCKDQHGCRFLQRQLELGGSEAASKIFNEIQLNVIELMIDPFGNYLIQKLLERVNEEQRTILVRNASSQFVRIALDPHGTRALQKLVECINTPTEFQIIINSLSSYIVLLSRDLNGNHVVQKCLQKLPPDSCDFIFDAACENSVKIAKHRHGCCVLQRCFDHGTSQQCERLSLKVGENCVELSVDPYGNYVVQYVLSMEENRLRIMNDPNSATALPNTKRAIDFVIASLTESLVKLSTHKFGSNVIEKSLRIPTLAPVLINQLLKETTNLKLLLHDAYGNYVLQTALDVADDASFKQLSELLKPYLGDVRNTPHGRRILSKLISRGGASAGIFGGVSLPTQQPQDQLQSNQNQHPHQHPHQHQHQHQHHNHQHPNQHHQDHDHSSNGGSTGSIDMHNFNNQSNNRPINPLNNYSF